MDRWHYILLGLFLLASFEAVRARRDNSRLNQAYEITMSLLRTTQPTEATDWWWRLRYHKEQGLNAGVLYSKGRWWRLQLDHDAFLKAAAEYSRNKDDEGENNAGARRG